MIPATFQPSVIHSRANPRRSRLWRAGSSITVTLGSLPNPGDPDGTTGTLIAAGLSAGLRQAPARQEDDSRALQGDAALSGNGAATSLIALVALAHYHALSWWWADRVATLLVAVIAATEAWHTAPPAQLTDGTSSGPAGRTWQRAGPTLALRWP